MLTPEKKAAIEAPAAAGNQRFAETGMTRVIARMVKAASPDKNLEEDQVEAHIRAWTVAVEAGLAPVSVPLSFFMGVPPIPESSPQG